jgi:hypothetical protein
MKWLGGETLSYYEMVGRIFDTTPAMAMNEDLAHTDWSLCSTILVVEANDIILAEITADLNFDQFEGYLAGVSETMNAADRDICRLVLVDDADFVSNLNLGRTSDHHPVLGTMKVLLQ